MPHLVETHQAGHDVLVETQQAGHDVLGAALNVSRLKCVEHIDQWSLFFMIFIYLVFLKAKKIPDQNVHVYMGIEPRSRVQPTPHR